MVINIKGAMPIQRNLPLLYLVPGLVAERAYQWKPYLTGLSGAKALKKRPCMSSWMINVATIVSRKTNISSPVIVNWTSSGIRPRRNPMRRPANFEKIGTLRTKRPNPKRLRRIKVSLLLEILNSLIFCSDMTATSFHPTSLRENCIS